MATATNGFSPAPAREGDDRFVELARSLASEFGAHASEHDRDNTFVTSNYDRLKASGYTRLAIPEELGGLGASMRQVVYAQAELAKGCGATALAIAMHLYNTLVLTFRWKKGAQDAGASLRRVAENRLIIMTSGGSDGIRPGATAVRTDGGYLVSGRKVFCSQAPVADLMTTMARFDDPEAGPIVLMMALPVRQKGVEILETWDTLGMRATQSHDVQLTDVFVSDAQVAARRPWGKVDAPLRAVLCHFSPPVAAVYWGIAAGARDEAVRLIKTAHNPAHQRQVGLMDMRLQVAWWALVGALGELGDSFTPDARAVNLVQTAKREVVVAAEEVVDLAMETAGGPAFFRRSPIERAYRDVRAGKFHPLTPEKALVHAGSLALGGDVDEIW